MRPTRVLNFFESGMLDEVGELTADELFAFAHRELSGALRKHLTLVAAAMVFAGFVKLNEAPLPMLEEIVGCPAPEGWYEQRGRPTVDPATGTP